MERQRGEEGGAKAADARGKCGPEPDSPEAKGEPVSQGTRAPFVPTVRPRKARLRPAPSAPALRGGPGPRSYLHARLRQPQALAELLPHEGVGVVRLVEEPLQLVQLLQREVGAAASLLQLRLPVLVLGLHVLAFLLAFVDTCGAGRGRSAEAPAPSARPDPARPAPCALRRGPLARGGRLGAAC